MQAIQGARDLARSVRNRNYSEIENLVRDATSNHNIGPDEEQCRKILNALLNTPPGGYVYTAMFTMLWKRIVDIKYQLHVLKGLLLLSYLLKNKTMASQLIPDVKSHIHDIKVLMNYELGKGNLQGQNVRDEAGDIYFFIMNGLWKVEKKALEEKKAKEDEEERLRQAKERERLENERKKPHKKSTAKKDEPKPASKPAAASPLNAKDVFGQDFFDSYAPAPQPPKEEPKFGIPQVDMFDAFADEFANMSHELRPPSPPKPVPVAVPLPTGPSEEELARRRKAEEEERRKQELLRQQEEERKKREEEEAKRRARAEKWRKEKEDKDRLEREAKERADRERAAQEAIDRERRAQLEKEERERRARWEAEERERLAKDDVDRLERERLEREAREREARERAEREARERAEREAREKAEREARERAEAEERARREQEERDRLAREARERAEAEERERLRREQEERDRLALEEAERLRRVQEERDRLAREEAERLKREQDERDRLAQAEAERLRLEQEARERAEAAERERLRREQEERDRLAREEAERRRKEQEERDRLAREEAERLRREQEERDRLAREEADRLRREQEERDRLAREEAERLKREQEERERLEREAREAKERAEREERERLEREERERQEREEAERRRRTDWRNRPVKALGEDVRAELVAYGAYFNLALNVDHPDNVGLKPVMPILVGEGIGAPADKLGTDLLKKVEDGLVLAHYVNVVVPETIDARVLNTGDDLSDEDHQENVNLFLNAAKSIGVRTAIAATPILRANQDTAHQRPVTDVIWALIKLHLLNEVTLVRHPDLRECAANKDEADQMDRWTAEQLLMAWFHHTAQLSAAEFATAHAVDAPASAFEGSASDATCYTYVTILSTLLTKMKIQGGAQQRRASKTEEDIRPITDAKSLWARFASLSAAVNVRWSAPASAEALQASHPRIQLAYVASLFNRYFEIDEAAWEQERRDKDRKRKLKDFNDQWHGGEETSFRMWINSLGLSLGVEGELAGGKGLSAGGHRKVTVAAHADSEKRRPGTRAIDVYVNNLFEDCKDGLVLLPVLDHIAKDTVNWKTVEIPQQLEIKSMESKSSGSGGGGGAAGAAIISPFSTSKLSRLKAVNNNNNVVEIAEKLGLSIVNVGGVDIADGTQKIVLAIVWQMMRFHIVQFLKNLYAKALASGKITVDSFASGDSGASSATTPANKAGVAKNRRQSSLMAAPPSSLGTALPSPTVAAMDMKQFEKDSDFDNMLISWANKNVLRGRKNPNKGLQLFAASLNPDVKPTAPVTPTASAEADLTKGGTGRVMKAFNDPALADSLFLLELLAAISMRVVNWKLVKKPHYGAALPIPSPSGPATSPTAANAKELPTPAANPMLSCGLTKQEATLNARYVISAARKLGCTIFLSPEDIVQVKPKMILTIIASIMAVTLT